MEENRVVAYKYEFGFHCLVCARKRFGKRLNLPNLQDKNGETICPVRKSNKEWEGLFCDDCAEQLGD